MTRDPRVAVITHQLREELLRSLGRLRDLPEQPHVGVVDIGSTGGGAGGRVLPQHLWTTWLRRPLRPAARRYVS